MSGPPAPENEAPPRCPVCGCEEIDRIGRRGLRDYFCSIVGLYPFRCQRCGKEFYLSHRGTPPCKPEPSHPCDRSAPRLPRAGGLLTRSILRRDAGEPSGSERAWMAPRSALCADSGEHANPAKLFKTLWFSAPPPVNPSTLIFHIEKRDSADYF